MHKEYISSEENYQEYWDRLDNQLLMNSKIRLAKMYEEKAEKYSREAEKYSKEANKLSNENKDLRHQLHEEKVNYNQRIRNNINLYIQKEFDEDVSIWLNELNEEQLFMIQDHLYDVMSLDELKKLI